MTLTANPTTAAPARVPAGVHTGGQFTTIAKDEPAVALTAQTYPGVPDQVAATLRTLEQHGARITRMEDSHRWEVAMQRPGHGALFEVDVHDGRANPEVYHHWAHTARDPADADDGDTIITVDWQDPDKVSDTLLRWAGIATD